MKTYREIAELLEVHIDELMKDPSQAIENEVGEAVEGLGNLLDKTDNEDNPFTKEEKIIILEKLGAYMDLIVLDSFKVKNRFGVGRGLFNLAMRNAVKERLALLK